MTQVFLHLLQRWHSISIPESHLQLLRMLFHYENYIPRQILTHDHPEIVAYFETAANTSRRAPRHLKYSFIRSESSKSTNVIVQ